MSLAAAGCSRESDPRWKEPEQAQKQKAQEPSKAQLQTPAARPAPAAPRERPTAGAAAVGSAIPAFEADVVGADGKSTKWSSQGTARPTAYVFVGKSCPSTAAYVDRMKGLETEFSGKVDFVFIYPNSNESSADKAQYHRASGFAIGMVDDQGATLARLLGATKTTEVVLTAKDGTVLYRGAIDDNKHNVAAVQNRWVATAITEHLGGKAVSTPKTDVYA
jgi:hypothetical protein